MVGTKVGCAGFSIPQTRYFREFSLVEIQETQLGVPGEGTVRRWKREAPEGFEFTMLAPRDGIAPAFGGAQTKETKALFAAVLAFGRSLAVEEVVFLSPADFAPSRAHRATIGAFFAKVPKKGLTLVWEPPASWSPSEAAAVGSDSDLVVAVDPLANARFDTDRAYFRMPGPAGRRSRYEDAALSDLAAACRKVRRCTCIFANADMHSDGKRLKALLKLP
ncbi:MAG: DUF72 domain-containing protein [Deltaproteobacteria bacterium]|nr:DUF72 domain-containing protein [Deltaproteobacteria bacterium]